MNCREAKSLFSARVDGELSGIESAALENHLSVCGPCAEDSRSIASTVLLLRTMPEESPDPMFVGRVLDRVRGFEAEQLASARAARTRELVAPWWRRALDRIAPSPIPVGLALAVGAVAGFFLIQIPSGLQERQSVGTAIAKNETVSPTTTRLREQPVSPFGDLVRRTNADASGSMSQSVSNDSGANANIQSAEDITPQGNGTPVEVLAPDWWNSSAADPQALPVRDQNGGARIVVF